MLQRLITPSIFTYLNYSIPTIAKQSKEQTPGLSLILLYLMKETFTFLNDIQEKRGQARSI
jgi:hypothetical protein